MPEAQDNVLRDLLHEVPRLWDFIQPESLSSLLACSMSLRRLVHNYATAIKVVMRSEPSSAQRIDVIKLLVEGNWMRLRHLRLAFSQRQQMLPWVYKLDLSAEVISPLINGAWPDLTTLDLSWNRLNHEGIAVLAKANWPKLSSLNLTGTDLHKASIRQLLTASQSTLHSLQCLNLGNNMLNRGAVKMLVNSCCAQLTALELNKSISTADIGLLTNAHLPLLQHLNVGSKNLQAAGISLLVEGQWPQLKHLDLRLNDVGWQGMQYLHQSEWPLLESLDLSYNALGLDACQDLARLKSGWSHLRHFCLVHCLLTGECIAALLKGDWRSLQHLSLASNSCVVNELRRLTTAKLPTLQHLDLGRSSFHCSVKALIQLASAGWLMLR